QAEEDGTGSVGNIVQDLLAALPEIACVALIGVAAMESGGEASLRTLGPHLVAGDLLLHETIVGLVLIEAADDVVAIAPGVGPRLVSFKALAFGEAGEIEPVAPPSLAVARRGEQTVDDLVEGVGRVISEERRDLFGGGRQSDQVEGRTAKQRDLVGGRPGRYALRFELGGEETIDRVMGPGGTSYRGWRLGLDLLERPEVPLPLRERIGG